MNSSVGSDVISVEREHFYGVKFQTRSVTKKVKGALSSLRQFSTAESLLKMMENAFCFTVKALFDLKILNFLS